MGTRARHLWRMTAVLFVSLLVLSRASPVEAHPSQQENENAAIATVATLFSMAALGLPVGCGTCGTEREGIHFSHVGIGGDARDGAFTHEVVFGAAPGDSPFGWEARNRVWLRQERSSSDGSEEGIFHWRVEALVPIRVVSTSLVAVDALVGTSGQLRVTDASQGKQEDVAYDGNFGGAFGVRIATAAGADDDFLTTTEALYSSQLGDPFFDGRHHVQLSQTASYYLPVTLPDRTQRGFIGLYTSVRYDVSVDAPSTSQGAAYLFGVTVRDPGDP